MVDNQPAHQSARAFCQATGLCCQLVGLVLALGSCCWWSFSGLTQEALRPTQPDRHYVEIISDARPPDYWALACVSVLFCGGLALTPLGMGVQHARLGAGRWTRGFTAAVALFFWAYLMAALLASPRSMGPLLLAAVMAILWSVLFLLAGAALEQMRSLPARPSDLTWTAHDEDDLRKGRSPH